MNGNFTLLTYSCINTSNIDLIADAYGYLYMPSDLEEMLNSFDHTPEDRIISNILYQAGLKS